MAEAVFHEVAKLANPDGPPFAVIAIYPGRPSDGGCVGIVKSLHADRSDAEQAAEAFRNGMQ